MACAILKGFRTVSCENTLVIAEQRHDVENVSLSLIIKTFNYLHTINFQNQFKTIIISYYFVSTTNWSLIGCEIEP